MRSLVVVGGGITGLAAAYEATRHPDVRVTLVEASAALGGKIRTSELVLPDGSSLRVDEGADAFLARVPDAVELCHELGLADELTQPAAGRARVHAHGRAHDLPERSVLGVPTDPAALAASGSVDDETVARVAAELERRGPGPEGDVAIGPFLEERFGRPLVDDVVGPLVGGINAGDVDRLSLAAVTPQLAEAAAEGDSLVAALARRADRTAAGPVFHGLRGGTGRLVEALAGELDAAGATVRTGSPLATLEGLEADAVVLAVPAPAAADLLAGPSPEAAGELAAIAHSSVTLVTFVLDERDVTVDPALSGVLVAAGEGRLMTAVSFGSSKWPHWGDGGHVVLRASAGRTGDERQAAMSDRELVDALRADLRDVVGVTAEPLATRVSRYPEGFAQYEVGHAARVGRIEAALARDLPHVRVAGAAYRGLGIPACIRQGRLAVRDLLSG